MRARILLGSVLGLFSAITAPTARAQIEGLVADGPYHEYADKMMLFGQFVGNWDFNVVSIRSDGTRMQGRGEWHFGWALQGRAVQDVWIARDDISATNSPISEWGTTLRLYDPKADMWRVVWAGPMRSSVMAFTASRVGEEIVMEVDYAQGLPRKDSDALAPRGQWIFDQIKPDSFHWRAVMSRDGGKTWQLQQEMFVQRRKERPGKASDGRPCNFGASKSDVEQAKAEVAEIETDWLNALSNANVSAIDSFLAEDFVRPAPEYGQFATKDQVLSFYRSHLSPKNSRRSRIDNLTVSFYGAVALARGAVITTTADNQESSKTLFTDVFVRENGKWKAVSAQENGVPTQ